MKKFSVHTTVIMSKPWPLTKVWLCWRTEIRRKPALRVWCSFRHLSPDVSICRPCFLDVCTRGACHTGGRPEGRWDGASPGPSFCGPSLLSWQPLQAASTEDSAPFSLKEKGQQPGQAPRDGHLQGPTRRSLCRKILFKQTSWQKSRWHFLYVWSATHLFPYVSIIIHKLLLSYYLWALRWQSWVRHRSSLPRRWPWSASQNIPRCSLPGPAALLTSVRTLPSRSFSTLCQAAAPNPQNARKAHSPFCLFIILHYSVSQKYLLNAHHRPTLLRTHFSEGDGRSPSRSWERQLGNKYTDNCALLFLGWICRIKKDKVRSGHEEWQE